MGNSLKLGTIAGVRIQVHWTFLIIIAWVLLTSIGAGETLPGAIINVAFLLTLFGCVVLHELGHALAARAFGIPTRDITLLPIGGVARLERMPRKPLQELIVALAGPAVNVVIVIFLLTALLPTIGFKGLVAMPTGSAGFLQQLMLVNAMLIIFNLLPAFPMDGGRVLRALLATVTDYSKATRMAARVGQVCAVGLGLLGLANPFLLFIAIFIFFGAATEAQQVEMREQLGRYQVRDGMIRGFRALRANAPMKELAERLLDSPQQDYPVVDDGIFVGILRRDDLVAALQREDAIVAADVMQRDVEPVEESDALVEVLEQVTPSRGETLPVTSAGALTGLLDLRQVFNLTKARANLRRVSARAPRLSVRPAAPSLT